MHTMQNHYTMTRPWEHRDNLQDIMHLSPKITLRVIYIWADLSMIIHREYY